MSAHGFFLNLRAFCLKRRCHHILRRLRSQKLCFPRICGASVCFLFGSVHALQLDPHSGCRFFHGVMLHIRGRSSAPLLFLCVALGCVRRCSTHMSRHSCYTEAWPMFGKDSAWLVCMVIDCYRTRSCRRSLSHNRGASGLFVALLAGNMLLGGSDDTRVGLYW